MDESIEELDNTLDALVVEALRPLRSDGSSVASVRALTDLEVWRALRDQGPRPLRRWTRRAQRSSAGSRHDRQPDGVGARRCLKLGPRKGADMGLLRRRGGDDGTKYRMREKMFAIGDDFWIENEEDSAPSRSMGRRCVSVTPSCSRTHPPVPSCTRSRRRSSRSATRWRSSAEGRRSRRSRRR